MQERDANRVNLMLELSEIHLESAVTKSKRYAQNAAFLASDIGFRKGEGKAYYGLSNIYNKQGNQDSVLWSVVQAESIAYEIGDSLLISKCLVNHADYLSKSGNHLEAQELLHQALNISEDKNYTAVRLSILNSLGRIHIGLGDTDQCITYFKQGLALAESIEDFPTAAKLCVNLSIAYDSVESKRFYLEKAITIAEEHNLNRVLGFSYNSYSNLYTYQLNNPDSAIYFLGKGLEVAKRSDDEGLKYRIYTSLAEHYKSVNIDSAIHFYEVLLESDFQHYDHSHEVFLRSLAQLKKEKGQYRSAFTDLDSSYAKAERRYRYNLEQQVSEANTKYESEKKESEIARQELIINKQKNTRQLLMGGAVSGIALLGSLFFAYTQRSKRKQKENEVALQLEKQRADDLLALSKAKTDFFNNINHELRTPLSLVMAPLEDAKKKAKHIDLQNDIDMALKNSKLLLSLTDEIMDLARLDEGQLKTEKSTVHLRSYLHRVFNAFYSLAESRSIDLSIDQEIPKTIGITSDISKLEKILNNLISNAIKYSNAGDYVKLKLDANALESDVLKISIEDNGQGIPHNELPHVFDRYFQSSITPQASGTGIGLAFVKELCQLLAGDIQVVSTLGEGSTFTFSLPVDVTSMSETSTYEEKSVAIPVLPTLTINNSKPNILIVEDNQDMANYLTDLLSKDYNCTHAVNGKDAIGIMQSKDFDLISSDIMMPEMDGFQFREEINKNEKWKTTPFILLSARTLEEDKLRGFQLGIDDYITKPFSASEYQARVYNLLKNKISRSEDIEEVVSFKDDLIEKAKKYVIEHLDDSNFKVQNLADELNYSTKQLGRILKKQTGLTPVEFLLELRMLNAYQLLKDRKFSTVNEVRYQIGIESPSYFATKFKERFGISPSELGE